MVQESKSRVAVIGGGPAGCFCAYNLQEEFDVTVFEAKSPLATILVTGGGRCNLAHYEFDFKELAKNYPRGEKFLYSVLSRFSTAETIEFFQKIGIETYPQEDMRIFPESNSAVEVREKFLQALKKVRFVNAKVCKIGYSNGIFTLNAGGVNYSFPKVVIAIGGHAGFELAKMTGHNVVQPKPSLAGLRTIEDFSSLSGVALKNVCAKFDKKSLYGDVMFTHTGITGPLIYKISAIKARDDFPYKFTLDLVGDIDLQAELNSNPHKSIKNLLSDFVPKSFVEFILGAQSINHEEKCHRIDGKTRDRILNLLQNFEISAIGTRPDGEVVTSGGVDLKEINPKTMESKLVKGLYFCGEVIDVDGFCGGFNLQNCWSTAFVAGMGIRTSQDNRPLNIK